MATGHTPMPKMEEIGSTNGWTNSYDVTYDVKKMDMNGYFTNSYIVSSSMSFSSLLLSVVVWSNATSSSSGVSS